MYSEDTLFLGLAGRGAVAGARGDVSNVLNYLPKIHDFGNSLVGERFSQQRLPDLLRKLKVLSHLYMQIGLFDDEVVFRVGSRVSDTQYQEYRWLLNKDIYYEPLNPGAENPRIFTLTLSPACSRFEPEKHGDTTSTEGRTIDSMTDFITSVIRDTLDRRNGRVGFGFVLQCKKYDQSLREMFDSEDRPPTEYWSDRDYPMPTGDGGSQNGSQSEDGPHYYREPHRDPSRSRERHRSSSSSSSNESQGRGLDNDTAPTPAPGRNSGQRSDHSTNKEGASRERSQDLHESEERGRDPSRGRGRSSSSGTLEWYQPPGYYRPKGSTEQDQSRTPNREPSRTRNKRTELIRTPEGPRRSRSRNELQPHGNSRYYQPTAVAQRGQSISLGMSRNHRPGRYYSRRHVMRHRYRSESKERLQPRGAGRNYGPRATANRGRPRNMNTEAPREGEGGWPTSRGRGKGPYWLRDPDRYYRPTAALVESKFRDERG